MFHAKEGLYFERQPDGGVHVIVKETALDEAPILRIFDLTPGVWKTITDQMAPGEERWIQNHYNPLD